MRTSSRVTTRTARTVGCLVAAAATTLGPGAAGPASARPVGPVSVSSAVAHEPPPDSSAPSAGAVSATVWYATPLESLGGRTLAQYLADHETRVLATTGS